MSRLLTGSIDVTKIDKSKLIDGKKGKYLPLTIWINDELDQFGNIASIQVGQSKEEREAGQAKVFLGNLKEFSKNNSPAKAQAANAFANAPQAPTGADDDLPF